MLQPPAACPRRSCQATWRGSKKRSEANRAGRSPPCHHCLPKSSRRFPLGIGRIGGPQGFRRPPGADSLGLPGGDHLRGPQRCPRAQSPCRRTEGFRNPKGRRRGRKAAGPRSVTSHGGSVLSRGPFPLPPSPPWDEAGKAHVKSPRGFGESGFLGFSEVRRPRGRWASRLCFVFWLLEAP